MVILYTPIKFIQDKEGIGYELDNLCNFAVLQMANHLRDNIFIDRYCAGDSMRTLFGYVAHLCKRN